MLNFHLFLSTQMRKSFNYTIDPLRSITTNLNFKDNVRIEHRMLTSAIKKQTSVCSFYFIKLFYSIQTWKYGITEKEKTNRKQFYCYC